MLVVKNGAKIWGPGLAEVAGLKVWRLVFTEHSMRVFVLRLWSLEPDALAGSVGSCWD
jgi:hypothetical protein